jgi:multiple antibiotic resistance protein
VVAGQIILEAIGIHLRLPLLTYILLLFSDAILRIIGRQGAAILVRVMGIILASLAVEIVLTTLGVASWAPVSR